MLQLKTIIDSNHIQYAIMDIKSTTTEAFILY